MFLLGKTTFTTEVATMQYKVEVSGVNTAKLPVLKHEETRALLIKCRAGDEAAREQLISGNLRLVLSVIQRFMGRGENADDLFQVGCIGLIKAIDNFDLDAHDVRFSTYGVPMIIGEIRRHLRDGSPIRVSRSLRDTAYRVLQAKEQYINDNGKEPTEDELAELLNIKREEIVFALEAIADTISLNEPVFSESGDHVSIMDQVSDNRDTDEHWLEKIALNDAMKQLDSREKKILAMRYMEGRTQMEVAGEIGISQAQVSRLEKNAINRIKKDVSGS